MNQKGMIKALRADYDKLLRQNDELSIRVAQGPMEDDKDSGTYVEYNGTRYYSKISSIELLKRRMAKAEKINALLLSHLGLELKQTEAKPAETILVPVKKAKA
jgi:hypothetical protein